MAARTSTDMTVLELLKQETASDMLEVESVTTTTLYEVSDDCQATIKHLREKYWRILGANPWLQGRLVKKKGVLSLIYPNIPTQSDSPGFIVVDSIQKESFTTLNASVHDYSIALAPFVVKKATKCINKDEPLFRIIVGKTNPSQLFVTVSISHVIADGYTFYRIYAMLSSEGDGSEPQALNAKRNIDGGARVFALYHDIDAVLKSVGLMCNMIGSYLFGKRANIITHEVDMAGIQRAKEAYSASLAPDAPSGTPRFLSTNDILTSSYMASSECDLGLMAVNYRNRLDGLTSDLAGNYEGVIGYQKGDYESPEFIRQSLDTYCRRDKDRPLLAGGFFFRRKAVLGMVTNWSGFYRQIRLPGCNHVAHFPIFDTIEGPFVLNVCVIFMVDENKMAVLSAEHPKRPVASRMEALLK